MGTGWDKQRMYENVSEMVGSGSERIGGVETGRLVAQIELTERSRG
jgi:hypothetical protein